MKIIFLGTSGSMPTPSRSSSAVAIRRMGELLLFDCGEGTQQRMVSAHLGFGRPMRIFISHLHGDHVLGLPGLVQTMTLLRRERPLHVYGPRGLLDFIRAFSSVLGGPGFPLRVCELSDEGIFLAESEYKVEAARADHEGESWSYALTEHPKPGRFHPESARDLGVPEGPLWKRLQRGGEIVLSDGRRVKAEDVTDPPRGGRKIVYSGDTRPKLASALMEGADVIIHESTFDDDLAERAAKDGHSTAGQAAQVAAAARAGLLVLTHISSRYYDTSVLLEQALKVFPNTRIAEDLMEIELPP